MAKQIIQTKEKLKNIEKSLASTFKEREPEIHRSILAILARTTHLMYGPPGTAKSAVIKAICSHIKDAKYFSTLMFQDLPPDAILGPINPLKFKEGEFCRTVDGYLPGSHIAFIDEVFKASPTVLNCLYNIMNEREFKNGSELLDVPCRALFFACNKVDEKDPALLDRFVLKSKVRRVQRSDHIGEIIGAWNGGGQLRRDEEKNYVERYNPEECNVITLEELDRATGEMLKMEASSDAIKAAASIYLQLNQSSHDLSERKIKQAMLIAAAEAYLSGDKSVGPGHLICFMDVLPRTERDISAVSDIILTCIDPNIAELFKLWNSLTDDYEKLMGDSDKDKKSYASKLRDQSDKAEITISRAREILNKIPSGSEGQSTIKERCTQALTYMEWIGAKLTQLSGVDLQKKAKLR